MRMWLGWTGATFAGLTLGAGGAQLLVDWTPRQFESLSVVLAVLVWGGLVGVFQALALRLNRRAAAWWTAATAVALLVSGGWWLLPGLLQTDSPNAHVLTASIYWGFVPGALMGLTQARLLLAHTRHPAWWVIGSAVGWGLAAAAGFLLWREVDLPAALIGAIGMVHFYLAFLIGGMLTGVALVQLLRRTPLATANEPPAS